MRAGWTGGRPLPIRSVLAALGVTAALGWLHVSQLTPTAPPAQLIPLPLRHVGVVTLPGESTRFDYADIDPSAHRLFLSHMDDNALLVVDTATRQVTRTVTGLPEVTGMIVVPSLHRVFASAAGAGQVVTLDEDTNTVLAGPPPGHSPMAWPTSPQRDRCGSAMRTAAPRPSSTSPPASGSPRHAAGSSGQRSL